MKQKLLLGILGTGGFGREVMPIAKSAMECISNKNENSAYEIVFVDSNPEQKLINNINVLSIDEFFEINCDSRYFNIAIASNFTSFGVSSFASFRRGFTLSKRSCSKFQN